MHDAAPPPDYDPIDAEAPYPYQDLVGFRLAAWSEGFARVELDLAEAHMNRHGIPHGGVHAGLLDTALGFCGCWCPWPGRVRRAMTLSLTLNYVGRPQGRRLIAEARQTGGGRTTYFADGTLVDDTGAVLATASAVMRWRGAGGDLRGDPA